MLFLLLQEDASVFGSSAQSEIHLVQLGVGQSRRWVLDRVGNGVWSWGILKRMCVLRKSLVLGFSCGNLESYHQNVCFVFRKPYFP